MSEPSETAGTRDGTGPGGDHDQPFDFGTRLTTAAYSPFSTLTFARLQILLSHVNDGDRVPEILVLANPVRFGLNVQLPPSVE